MRQALVLPALIAALSFGCSSSTPKPADDPSGATAGSDPASPGGEGAAKPGGDDAAKQDTPAPGVKGSEGGAKHDDSIPDDYSLTNGDCDALGKQYASVAKADQMAGMSPKLSAKQKEQAEENIDKVVGKLSSQWIESCQNSLVGKIVDHKVLKCAMEARTVADFKTCLGDESKPADKAAGKPGKK